jgi:GntR family transcriptional regulator
MPRFGRLSQKQLHLQVRDELVRMITSGHWKPGSALPNELQIAREFGVSPDAVRKALEAMVEQRIVVYHRDRGTFVSDQVSGEKAQQFCKLHDTIGERLAPHVHSASIFRGPATAAEVERLEIPAASEVVRLQRLHAHNGRPFMMERLAFAARQFARWPDDIGEYELGSLAQRNGIFLGRAAERISVAPVEADQAAALGVEVGTPVVVLDRVAYAADLTPLQWRLAWIHADRAQRRCS